MFFLDNSLGSLRHYPRFALELLSTSAIDLYEVIGSSFVWMKPRLCQKFAASSSIALTISALPPTSFAPWMQVVRAYSKRPEPIPWPAQFLSTANCSKKFT